jgi:hypothetical protein
MVQRYKELSKAKISPTRNFVISAFSGGGFTIAQQIETEENGKTTSMFMREAMHVIDLHSLYEIRDAVNMAIKVSEDDVKANWDK